MKKIIKGLLLWSTIFIITVFIMSIDTIMDINTLYFVIGVLICIISVLVCYITINEEELKELLLYKWLNDNLEE